MTNRHQIAATSTRSLQIDHLLLAVVLLAVFVLVNVRPIPPNDFWWHMKAGEVIVQTQRIPNVDEFSFTMPAKTYDSYAQFWLAESLFYVLHRLGGMPLLIFAHGLAVTLAYGFLFAASAQVSGWRSSILGLLFAVALGFTNWSIRPQGLVLPLAGLLIWCIVHSFRRQRWKALLAAPPIMLVWANSHGSWTIGALLLGIWFLARLVAATVSCSDFRAFIRQMAFPASLTFASLVAVLANPRGPRIFSYVWSMASDPVSQSFGTEWVSPMLKDPLGAVFFAGFLLCSVVLMVSPRRPDVFELCTYLVFAVLALRMIRAILWFGMVMAPTLALHLDGLFLELRQRLCVSHHSRPAPDRRTLNAAILGVLIVVALCSTPWIKPHLPIRKDLRELVSAETPVAAVDFLMTSQLGPDVFNGPGFGSYLIWAASPTYRVYIDTRFELYTLDLVGEYFWISAAREDWEDMLSRRGVDTMLLSQKSESALIRAAAQSSLWHQLYADDRAVIFVRNGEHRP